jgi:urate oxidase
LSARWTYAPSVDSFQSLRSRIRGILVGVFADHSSKSVQHTLYAMGEAALEQVSEIEDIQLSMPNKHCLLVDLSRFGQDNPNEVFLPIDEPHGFIEARLRRG